MHNSTTHKPDECLQLYINILSLALFYFLLCIGILGLASLWNIIGMNLIEGIYCTRQPVWQRGKANYFWNQNHETAYKNGRWHWTFCWQWLAQKSERMWKSLRKPMSCNGQVCYILGDYDLLRLKGHEWLKCFLLDTLFHFFDRFYWFNVYNL